MEDRGDEGFVVRYEGSDGSLLGGLAINRPDLLGALRSEVTEAASGQLAATSGRS